MHLYHGRSFYFVFIFQDCNQIQVIVVGDEIQGESGVRDEDGLSA